jgi:hypothetical protein
MSVEPKVEPRFSIMEYRYHRQPIVEILKDGGPVHAKDKHFRFGLRKAQMVLACMDVLKEFGWSTDEERLCFQPQIIEDRDLGISVRVFVEMQPDFVRSTGELIDERWLKLEASPPYQSDSLGLGVMKCRALSSVQGELRAWVRRRGRARG